MWNALETLLEDTEDVNQSKINTFTQQYKLFHMEEGENISSMQIWFNLFTHASNHTV